MAQLFDKITSLTNLADAWDEVSENKSAPGVDGVTIEEYARHWEANLIALRQEVRGNRYKPDPLKRFTIPKRDGSPRLLGNLTLRDKILQRAVLRQLDDIYEQRFLDCSFAYRPKRSIHNAIAVLVEARDSGRRWVLDADIDEFFDSLDHDLLMRFLRETLDDEQVMRLISLWLFCGRPDPNRAVGTPLGAIISPLLSNIYLHYLDLVMTHKLGDYETELLQQQASQSHHYSKLKQDWVFARYADDFVALCRSYEQAELALRCVEETLTALRLSIEPSKTAITTFRQGFDYLGYHFKGNQFYFECEGKRIKVKEEGSWELFYNYGPEGYQ